MWKIVFLVGARAFSASPLDAGEHPKEYSKMEKPGREDLRRDVERISKEIYRPARSGRASPRSAGPSPAWRRSPPAPR